MLYREFNFDGIVGPTHNYAGLSYGNVASTTHQKNRSNPKAAALEGLQKMKTLAEKGIGQGWFPPQERPFLPFLRSIGFEGKDSEVLEKASRLDPVLLAISASASSMWTANAATVSPSLDTLDQKVHFTPANLSANPHRSLEASQTFHMLQKTFPDPKFFEIHAPLQGGAAFSDEGAANHTRFCASHGEQGVEFFVYGKSALNPTLSSPKKFPGRQTLESSVAISRSHKLKRALFELQNPEAIDQGVFHNDVISVGNERTFLVHEKAFLNLKEIQTKIENELGTSLHLILVPEKDVPLSDAVESYLFNSQLISTQNNKMLLVAPKESENNERVRPFIESIVSGAHSIEEVLFLNVTQSMKNGGGPACLRLRVVLSEKEKQATHPEAFFSESKYRELTEWVEKHFRDRLDPEDLADPKLLNESRAALDHLTQILNLGSLYGFQK